MDGSIFSIRLLVPGGHVSFMDVSFHLKGARVSNLMHVVIIYFNYYLPLSQDPFSLIAVLFITQSNAVGTVW